MKPLNNYVLVRIETEEEKTSGGLYVPQGTTAATDILKKGEVVEISKKVNDNEEVDLSVGDIVYYNKHAITKVPESKELILIRLEDLYSFEKRYI